MSRFRVDHPIRDHIHAIYGHDPVLGFFVDVFMEGRDKPLAAFDHFSPAFNRAQPLLGCLDFMVTEGFFTGDDLESALVVIADVIDDDYFCRPDDNYFCRFGPS
jgi:hypothetical protein